MKRIKRIQLITAEAPPQGANFLIIGSDTRQFVDNPDEEKAFGQKSGDAGSNSDTLMVAHVEPGAQRTLVVSFPRDLMVNVPGLNGKSRINAAYSAGGPQLVIDTLTDNFDIDIHHYVEVDFKSFQDVVDAIGKVSVYVPGPVRDLETGLYIPDGPGCVALDGGKRSQYVRSRTMQILDPTGSIVDPDTGPTLASARRARRPRSHPAPAGLHPQARRRRDRQEPERPLPRHPDLRQRARGHQGRPVADP